jgi:hypothetical protein
MIYTVYNIIINVLLTSIQHTVLRKENGIFMGQL